MPGEKKILNENIYFIKYNGSFSLNERAEDMHLLVDCLLSQYWSRKFLLIAVLAADYKDRDGSILKTPGNHSRYLA